MFRKDLRRHMPAAAAWLASLILGVVILIWIYLQNRAAMQQSCSRICTQSPPTVPPPAAHVTLERVALIPPQHDEWLIQHVRKKYLQRPPHDSDYKLTIGETNPDQSEGQVDAVKRFFENTSSGFFVECGAFDGEHLSNTLWFEKVRGWDGLLIEADRLTFRRLRSKNRKAWHANACLSPTPYPAKLNFYTGPRASDGLGAAYLHGLKTRDSSNVTVPVLTDCVPLYTLLAAINQTVVELFSLDVEGAEIEILKTIPFHKVEFKVFVVETWDQAALNAFMFSKGFLLYRVIKTETGFTNDSIYVHKSLLPTGFKYMPE